MQRTALVIGGAGALGAASCEALARMGLRIAVADLDRARAAAVAATLPGEGHAGFAVEVEAEAAVAALFDRVEAAMGPVGVMANFSGLLIAGDEGRIGLAGTSLEEWERSQAVNARGCFLAVREMLRRRLAAPVRHGRIITISSLAGQVGGVRGSAAYAAAKGAVLTMTKTAAREGGPAGLTANVIAPGMIDTPMLRLVLSRDEEAAAIAALPVRRLGRPEDIAAATAFLASEQSGFVTGATLDVNGGQYLR